MSSQESQHATTVSPSSSSETPSTPLDAIFIPINLEVSLGRIEDDSSYVPIRSSTHSDDMDAMSMSHCDQTAPMDDESIYRPRTTSTSEGRDRLPPLNQAHVISPYPLSPTEAELRDRERLVGAVEHLGWTFKGGPLEVGDDDEIVGGNDIRSIAPTSPMLLGNENDVGSDAATGWPHSDMELIPDDDDNCDDFSIPSDEAASLVVEDLDLHRIRGDASSFWEDGIEVNNQSQLQTQQQTRSHEASNPACVSIASHRRHSSLSTEN